MILKSDNGSEFHRAALNSTQRRQEAEEESAVGQADSLSSTEITDVITEIRRIWPDCLMVRGLPRHSQSNGGVERVNRTIQEKLGSWMKDTNSRRWSVGCQLVMFRYNTQQHRTVGDIPYRLVFGQLPRVGISTLHLERSF